MTTHAMHVALLRGINLLGRNKLPMKELAAMFQQIGCEQVSTYIASGNVLFRAGPALARRIPKLAGAAIRDRYGFEPAITTRSAAQLDAIVAANPFPGIGVDEKMLHVVFLADTPSPAAVAKLDPQRSDVDEFAVNGSEVYLHCPQGYARTKLSNAWFDAQLGTVSTVRNWRTTRKLRELAGGERRS